jgi:membrane protein required for colicin V production
MNWVDWVIIIVMALATIGGIKQGLLRSVCSLGGLIFGLLIAAWSYGRVARVIMPFVRIEEVADAFGFLLIAIVIMVIAGLVGHIISKTAHEIGLGCLDRLAGLVFGFVQGAVMVTIFILVVLAFFPKSTWLTEGKLPRYFIGACYTTTHLSPEELKNRVHHGINEMEERAPKWMHPPDSQI